ncbi:MAG TPA: glycosyltransferase [Candidatus Sulfotelmatobacter sp.]|nr:glycosyltransferase [Candidatus Sulfotelmatobacter sp.]
MQLFWIVLTALLALYWILSAIDTAIGSAKIPALESVAPLEDSQCPTVSILFTARDEAEKLPAALETFLALDYPRLEVVAVDDRSEDATPQILGAAQRDSRLKFVRVNELPAGWLGKPHGLQKAFENSSGEWLVFTDADVHFSRDLLRRSVALAQKERWDHLTLLSSVEMHSPGEKITMTFFAMGFLMGVRPWRVHDPRSKGYAGVGAFQMIRRSAYEVMGEHRRLAMEVVDDMKLGKLVKEAGIRSGVAKAWDRVRVRWHAGVGNIVRGTTKNFFAAAGYNLGLAIFQLGMLLLVCVLPWVALPFLRGWALVLDAIAVGMTIAMEAGVAIEVGISPVYALTEPVGALVFSWMLARSVIVTLWSGGITWRGTFYPLEDLRRGVV